METNDSLKVQKNPQKTDANYMPILSGIFSDKRWFDLNSDQLEQV